MTILFRNLLLIQTASITVFLEKYLYFSYTYSKPICMKQFLLLGIVCLSLTGCVERKPTNYLTVEGKRAAMYDQTIRKSLSDVWLNTSSFCSLATNDTCANQLNALQHELNDLNPVPVPQPGEAMPLSITEATVLYKNFVTEHPGEPILAIFQQLYPRILLNKYGVLKGRDYELIYYYADQLAQSAALDFDTRINALCALHSNVPAEKYTYLLNKTLKAADAESLRQQQEIKRLKKLTLANPKEFNPSDTSTYRSSRYRAYLKDYQTSNLTVNLRRLDSLQQIKQRHNHSGAVLR